MKFFLDFEKKVLTGCQPKKGETFVLFSSPGARLLKMSEKGSNMKALFTGIQPLKDKNNVQYLDWGVKTD